MRNLGKTLLLIVLLNLALTSCIGGSPSVTNETAEPTLRLAASIYVGWMPWFLAAENGTLQKHAAANDVDIKFIQGDYIETINQFAAGGVDAVVLTNIDALALLIGSGVETDVILIGSYSNGNDAILLQPGKLPEQDTLTLGMVEFSVSHYLLDRYQQINPSVGAKIKYLNVSDAEIAAAFAASSSNLDGVVTWNPIVLQIEQTMNGQRIFDSGMLKKEIADMLVVRREVLQQHPAFAQALLATWFDMMAQMEGSKQAETLGALGRLSGADEASYRQQLETTLLMDQPIAALEALRDNAMQQTMIEVAQFVEQHNLITSPPALPWVSYPGQAQAILHFNDAPLTEYVTNQP